MKARLPLVSMTSHAQLKAAGETIRARRKALGVTMTAAAASADMSRMTWHRIEQGAPNVAMSAYVNAAAVLGLEWRVELPEVRDVAPAGWLPARVRLADYPQLRKLAWHVQGVEALSPSEAWAIYQRHGRHLDETMLETRERHLIDALREVFAEATQDV